MAGFPKAGDVYGGRYRIVRHLGHGGMGSVYEATDTVLERSVALKIVLPSLTDRDDYQARFAREASVLARIRSRHIVGIHEYGQDEDTVYFVTELFPDGDLQSWLVQHGPLERAQALSLTAQVCEALADAHGAGVIHRDVKPGNVLLWRRAEGLIPYLCDFGIALDGKQGLTRTGTLVGSPAYMAPERHFGHPADERGDIYSVGCLLWAALTGDAPYSGTDFQVMNAHINEPVPQLRTSNPVDRRIDEVLAASLQKDPERRIGSAGEMRHALLTILAEIEGRPAPAAPPAADPAAAVSPEPSVEVGTDDSGTRVVAAPTPGEPDTEAEPPDAAPSGSSTVIRRTPSSPGATPGVAPPPGAHLAATTDGAPPRGSRRGLWAVAAVVVLTILGGTAWAIGAGGDDDRAPVAGEPTPRADGPSASPSEAPPPAPKPPRVSARSAYRSVVFTVRPAVGSGNDGDVEYRDGDSWRSASGRVTVRTERGGDRGCLVARTASVQGGDPSRSVRTCGRAEPATVRFIRNTDDPCVNSVGGPCTWYDVAVTGFPSSASPLVRVRRPDGSSFCGGPCDFDRIDVGKDGRGYLPRDWKISRDEGEVILDVDGVTGRFRLYY